jgi:sugar phosphate isomerase/epimerase
MALPFVRLPYNLIDDHKAFVEEKKLGIEIYLSSGTLDSGGPEELAFRINEKLSFVPAFTLHAPFMDLSPGAVDSGVRASTLGKFLAVTEVAGLIKAKCVVFHSGYEKWKYDHSMEPWLGNSLEFWPQVIDAARDAGTRIAIENIFEEDPGGLKLLMEGIDTSVAGICFDTGHFNIFSRLPLKAWMDQMKEYIIELHLHDNKGDRDSHLPPGEGTFDFRQLYEFLEGREVINTIEANSPEETMLSIERLNLHV